MKIKTTMRNHFTPVRIAIVKKTTDNKSWWEFGEKGTLVTVGENVNWCSHYGKQYEGTSKNSRNRTVIWSSSFTPGYVSGKNKITNSKIYTHLSSV